MHKVKVAHCFIISIKLKVLPSDTFLFLKWNPECQYTCFQCWHCSFPCVLSLDLQVDGQWSDILVVVSSVDIAWVTSRTNYVVDNAGPHHLFYGGSRKEAQSEVLSLRWFKFNDWAYFSVHFPLIFWNAHKKGKTKKTKTYPYPRCHEWIYQNNSHFYLKLMTYHGLNKVTSTI